MIRNRNHPARRRTRRIFQTTREAKLMFRSEKIRDADIDLPLPTPAATSAGVKRTAAHQALAEAIEKLSAERAATLDSMKALIAEFSETNDSAIRKLEKRREKIENELRPLRMQVRHHCDAHAAAVAAALQPVRRDKARLFLRLSAELSAATQYLNDCESAIDAAGGQVSYDRIQTNYGHAEFRARQLAGLEGGQ
jgi:chromosome segregation ATPase